MIVPKIINLIFNFWILLQYFEAAVNGEVLIHKTECSYPPIFQNVSVIAGQQDMYHESVKNAFIRNLVIKSSG